MNTTAVRPHWSEVLAATVRFTQNLELAQAAVEAVFTRAQPDRSVTNLVASSRAIALDLLRRDLAFVSDLPLLVIADEEARSFRRDVVRDDRRALAYLCCHPALPMDTRVTLMLRLMVGLQVREIADRLNEPEAAVAARLAAGSRQIRATGLPFETPDQIRFAERVHPVLAVMRSDRDETCSSLEASANASEDTCDPWWSSSKPWRGAQEMVRVGSAANT